MTIHSPLILYFTLDSVFFFNLQRGHSCREQEFFLFKETKNFTLSGWIYSYSYQLDDHKMHIKCSCDDNRLSLGNTKRGSWFQFPWSFLIQLILIIEQSGVQLCLKSYVCQTTRRRKHDFKLKLHYAQFNYHFITSIWKSHNLIACFFKAKFWELKLQNSPHNGFLCISYSCNFIGYF